MTELGFIVRGRNLQSKTALVNTELGLIVRWIHVPLNWSHILDHLQSKRQLL